MANQVRVFVSHHHSPEEDAFTARLVADLEAAGADVWVDIVGVGAADFQKRINQALAICNWFVLVLTPAAITSPWVEMEMHAAIRLKAQGHMQGIIQVMAQTVSQDQIPPTWGIYAHLDAIRDYATALKMALGEISLASAITTLPPPTSPPPSIPRDRFPPRLASLGYQAQIINGMEIILPPLCDVPADAVVLDNPKKSKALPESSLPTFQIASFPVTVAEYACFVSLAPHEPYDWNTQLGKLDNPVVNISWYDAAAYASWLAQVTGEPWRLPTEDEWVKAAHGTDEHNYPWGNWWDSTRSNTSDNFTGAPSPVGMFAIRGDASPYGVHDMVGNVWEWTNSTDDGGLCILHGGAFNASLSYVTRRVPTDPIKIDNSIGFRLVVAGPSN